MRKSVRYRARSLSRVLCFSILLAPAGCREEAPPETAAPAPAAAENERRGNGDLGPQSDGTPASPDVPAAPTVRPRHLFTDITEEAGIDFVHYNDASPRKYLPETMGSGAAFFDYDNDGLPDLYLVNGAPLAGDRRRGPSGKLYRNLGGGKFEDVTTRAGLTEPFYGMGVAVGDFDNDGHTDLFITGLEGDRLYRNRGDGTFEDVTREMGLTDIGFGSSAAFLDYDRDGYLDLFVGRYVEWSLQTDRPCSPDGVHQIYCTPEGYPGQSNRLYRNLRGRGFQDVTRSSGMYLPEGKTLGVVVLDHNRDGWPDLAIANDTVRNFLFINKGDGTFEEVGVQAGMAYSESGATRGGMGIDAEDADGDGLVDVVIGNFSQEMAAFYHGRERGFFIDDAAQVGIGIPTLMTLAFGTLLIDFDNDGWLDVVILNGHIEPDIAQIFRSQTYAQAPQFFRNDGRGQFEPVQEDPSSPLMMPLVGRGLAAADIDGDGTLDLIITQNGRSARLWRNNSPPQSWLRLQFVGTRSNRTGYGTEVKVVAGDRTWRRTLVSGRSYLSANEPVLTIGLGQTPRVDRLEITWPSGTVQTLSSPELNRLLLIQEPSE